MRNPHANSQTGHFIRLRPSVIQNARQGEAKHRRPDERESGNGRGCQWSEVENVAHPRFPWPQPLREHPPVRRFDDDRLSGLIAATHLPDRFRNSLYVNEEASYREASFVDCGGQFTSTCRTLSIAIASPKTIRRGRPQATNGASRSLAVLRRAVNPYLPRRPRRSNVPVATARLHAIASPV